MSFFRYLTFLSLPSPNVLFRYLILSLQIPKCSFSETSFFPYRVPNVLLPGNSFFPYRVPNVSFQVTHSFLTDSQKSISINLILSLQIPKHPFQVSHSFFTDSQMSFPVSHAFFIDSQKSFSRYLILFFSQMPFSSYLILSLQSPKCPFPGNSFFPDTFPEVLFQKSNSFLTDSQTSFSKYLILLNM